MKTSIDCIPCFIRQTFDAVRMLTDDAGVLESVVRSVLSLISDMAFTDPPPLMGQAIHRLIRTACNDSDPYREVKQQSNRLALGLYPVLKSRIRNSAHPFETALRLSIAGNIIDFGTSSRVTDETVHSTIQACYHNRLNTTAVEQLQEEVRRASNILYLGDNAGEIVFDRLFIEELPREKVTYVVRGSPTINDATMADAREVGMTEIVSVRDNGTDIPGTHLEKCPESFTRLFNTADIIIAKGQGNYETLSDSKKNIFFLFTVKCAVIAYHAGCSIGESAIIRGGEKEAGVR